MSKKCFITEYNVAIENDDVKKFGVLTLKCVNNSNTKYISIAPLVPITITAKGGSFVDSSGQNPTSFVDLLANRNNTVYLEKNKETIIEVPSKYDLENLLLANGIYVKDINDITYCTNLVNLTLGSANPGTIIFEYLTRLENFIATYKFSEFRGNIEELANATNLIEISIDHSPGFRGNIAALSALTKLKRINLENTYIEGDANIFADSSKFVGLSLSGAELNIKNAYGITNKTPEVKTLIETAHPGISVIM